MTFIIAYLWSRLCHILPDSKMDNKDVSSIWGINKQKEVIISFYS